MSLLECQHEEKPSIQKLVNTFSHDCTSHLSEEATLTDAYILPTPRVEQALLDLQSEFSPSFIDKNLLKAATETSAIRIAKREAVYTETVCLIFGFLASELK